MEQQNLNPIGETKKRPQFLTILCILSFVGIGIALIGGIYNLLTFSSTIALMQGTSGFFVGELGDAIEMLIKWGQTIYVINIIASLICLLGVFMMWNMKKTGYFIYIIGEIAPAIASFVLLGGFGPLGTMAMVGGLIFPIAFIIMYGANLKYLS